jgi:hypothetical protein
MNKEIATEIIKLFGGVTKASRAMGLPLTTVHAWKYRGIPAWRIDAIKKAIRRKRLPLPEAFKQ